MCFVLKSFQFTCPSRSTTKGKKGKNKKNRFQFTGPSRSTTAVLMAFVLGYEVSIHVPLAEHDATRSGASIRAGSFNSRAPRGARRLSRRPAPPTAGFNSRAPRGARRQAVTPVVRKSLVSIHVPLAEHDLGGAGVEFQALVSIHVPLAEHD